MAFTIAYLISVSMSMDTSPPNLHSGSASPVVSIASSTDHSHPSSIEDCEAPDWFECHNKRCIVAAWMCDHENDCMDWSDEDYFLCKVAAGFSIFLLF